MSRIAPLALLLLSMACTEPGDGPAATDTDPGDSDTPPEPATATWMAQEIPPGDDDIPLRELLLPGTFNSSSYACDAANGISPDAPDAVKRLWDSFDPDAAPGDGLSRERIVGWSKAQDQSLATQLLDGIRVLEVNFTLEDGVLTTWHSVYGEPLDDALDQIVTFAASHPSEVIVMGFGPSIDEADGPRFADALVAPRADGRSFCDLLFTGTEPSATATLAQVRASGRNLIWSPSGPWATLLETRGDCPSAPFAKEYQGSGSTTTDGVIDKLEASVPTRAPDIFLHNDFFFYLGASGSDLAQIGFLAQYASTAEALEALGFAGDFPGELIERFDAEGGMNLFSGGHYDRTNLVQAVIERTRTRYGR